jgi:hypothetical protein
VPLSRVDRRRQVEGDESGHNAGHQTEHPGRLITGAKVE